MARPSHLRRLATRPSDYLKFQSTGRLPELVTPRSPLIDLLRAIAPRDRAAIVGVTVDPRVGYVGSRQFANAEQALNWAAPRHDILEGDSWPAEACRIKHFAGPLHLEDLLECASGYPERMPERYPNLLRMPAPGPEVDEAGEPPAAGPRPAG